MGPLWNNLGPLTIPRLVAAAGAGIAFVAGTAKPGSSAFGVVTTDPIDTRGANLIVVAVGTYVSHTGTISDSKSNTWIPLTLYSASDANSKIQFFYCLNPTTDAAHTFSTTPGTFSLPGVGVVAFSGVSAFVSESGALGLHPGSITATLNGSLFVTCSTANSPVDGGFTGFDAAYSGGTNIGCGIAYLIQGTAGAENPTWSGAGYGPVSAMALFAP